MCVVLRCGAVRCVVVVVVVFVVGNVCLPVYVCVVMTDDMSTGQENPLMTTVLPFKPWAIAFLRWPKPLASVTTANVDEH